MVPRLLLSSVVMLWAVSLGLVSARTSRDNSSSPAPVPAPAVRVATSQTTANEDCLVCHEDTDLKAEADGRSVTVDPSRYAASVHGALEMACTACHTDLEGVEMPHEAKLKKVDCSSCHEDQVHAYDVSIHASARRKDTGSVAATCVDCHGTHDMRARTDSASTTYPLNLPTTCAKCHGNADIITKGHIAAGNVAAQFVDSIHGRALSKSGLLVSANCTSCHSAHDIRQKSDPQSKVFRTNIPATCATCHEGIQAQFDRGSHGKALAGGNTKAPVCIDCHSAHQIQRADVATWRLDTVNECGTCHADKIKTYRDTFHGQVTSLGFVRVAKCADCHGAHEVHPKSDARSMVAPGKVVETCRTCHADATDAFAEYDPHADRDDYRRNPELFIASRFMHWLLIGVFGFFGLHALLWLPRSAAERRRHHTPPPADPEGPAA